MSAAQAFLDEVEGFLSTWDMKPTQFGKRALNDPTFVARLRDGRSVSTKTIDRVREFMTGFVADMRAKVEQATTAQAAA